MKKGLLITGIVLITVLAVFFYFRFYFVFGSGVKVGELNMFVYKGYIFKTYEGRLIQSGFRANQPGAVQSYIFDFSVADPKVAEELQGITGDVELHYNEYLGALPWRGMSKYIVTDVVLVKDKEKNSGGSSTTFP